ncbi:MAG TPA: alpha/beta family hydrolase [Humibacillus xanthopallidus]|nr:alpha/beta family hydrolase [Humibacillus xanthopallidus]
MSAPRETVREVMTPQGPARAHVCRPARAAGTVVLGHGAGGGLGALDLAVAREVLVDRGWAVVVVEQPWLVAGRKIAGRPPTLDEAWVPVVRALITGRGKLPRPLVVGGRSAGARVACRTAAELEADAGLLLSFPLHPPGQPAKLRAHELALAPDPSWVVQGTKDSFGTPAEVAAYLPAGATLLEVPGAHSFPRGSRAALVEALARVAGMLPG